MVCNPLIKITGTNYTLRLILIQKIHFKQLYYYNFSNSNSNKTRTWHFHKQNMEAKIHNILYFSGNSLVVILNTDCRTAEVSPDIVRKDAVWLVPHLSS